MVFKQCFNDDSKTADLSGVTVFSCKSGQETPVDTKYLKEFHLENFEPQEKYLQEGNLNLYVD